MAHEQEPEDQARLMSDSRNSGRVERQSEGGWDRRTRRNGCAAEVEQPGRPLLERRGGQQHWWWNAEGAVLRRRNGTQEQLQSRRPRQPPHQPQQHLRPDQSPLEKPAVAEPVVEVEVELGGEGS